VETRGFIVVKNCGGGEGVKKKEEFLRFSRTPKVGDIDSYIVDR